MRIVITGGAGFGRRLQTCPQGPVTDRTPYLEFIEMPGISDAADTSMRL